MMVHLLGGLSLVLALACAVTAITGVRSIQRALPGSPRANFFEVLMDVAAGNVDSPDRQITLAGFDTRRWGIWALIALGVGILLLCCNG